MYKKLRDLLAAAGLLLAPAFAQEASASHFQGAELTYACMAPNVYVVNLKMYRDCSGIPAPATMFLDLKSQGCNAGRSVTMARVGQPLIGNGYCPQITPGPGCTNGMYPNYEEVQFSATVTFSAAEAQCNNWILSIVHSVRPQITNLVNPQGDLYSEAYLNLAAGINNNSPYFESLVVPYINHSKPILLSTHAFDSDGDSLVYTLKDPLSGPSTPFSFSSYPAEILYNADSTKYTLAPPGNYSTNYPIHSYLVDWTQPMPITPVQTFIFNSQNGSMGFIPTRYRANTQSSLGENKYVTVVQADEYRKVNGVITRVGSVRRDMLITLIDCGPNTNPNITTPVANGQPISASDVINLRPGTPLTFQFASADNNASDVLTITSDAGTVLPGAVFTKTSANKPVGTITWTPTATHARSQIYYFHITVMDNACPIKGFQTHTYAVRVSNTGGVTGTKKELANSLKFMAFPNPFTETVSFKLNLGNKSGNKEILIYNNLGQLVDKIQLKNLASGEQTIVWENSAKLANGQYIARLMNDQQVEQTIQFSKLH